MFRIIVVLRVKNKADVGYIQGCLQEARAITLEEESYCQRFDIYHSESDPSVLILHEEWEQRQDWEDHRNKRAFLTVYEPKVLPLVEREPHISTLINTASI